MKLQLSDQETKLQVNHELEVLWKHLPYSHVCIKEEFVDGEVSN